MKSRKIDIKVKKFDFLKRMLQSQIEWSEKKSFKNLYAIFFYESCIHIWPNLFFDKFISLVIIELSFIVINYLYNPNYQIQLSQSNLNLH